MAVTRQLHNHGAEQSVLGACLLRPAIATWLDLRRDDFHDLRHKAIWSAIQGLQADQVAVDVETIADRMQQRGRLDAAGGYAYLGELATRTPTADNAEHYAAIVKSWAINRKVLEAGDHFRELLGKVDGEELLDAAQSYLASVDRPRALAKTLADCVAEEQAAIRDYNPLDEWVGLPTGIAELDEKIGGLPVGVTTILAARPSEGKSSLALAIARNTATVEPALVLTAEDRSKTMAQRVIADLAACNLARVRRRDLDLLEKERALSAAARGLEQVYIEHVHGQPMAQVVRTIRAYARLRGVKLVIFDYLQKCPKPRGAGNKNDAVEENINRFDDVVGELELAGLMVSQLSRQCEKESRRPRLSDLRDSGSLEQVAKLVLMLHPSDRDDELEIIVRKNHQGAREQVTRVRFEREFCRIA